MSGPGNVRAFDRYSQPMRSSPVRQRAGGEPTGLGLLLCPAVRGGGGFGLQGAHDHLGSGWSVLCSSQGKDEEVCVPELSGWW